MLTNIVSSKAVRETQLETLDAVATCLERTFGPRGSVTGIYKENAFPRFTKDGISVLREIKIDKPIEQSIVANLDSICTEQVKVVGDATTSIVLLSNIIFKELDKKYPAGEYYDAQAIVDTFKNAVRDIKNKIEENKQEVSMDAIRKIATISTNNNTELVGLICDIYEKYGMDVHIKVESSLTSDTYTKDYDGLVLDCGILDQAFANQLDNKHCKISNPKIYAFADPIDTPEMGLFFDKIVHDNIIEPIQHNAKNPENPMPFTPTVIMTPKLSRDFSGRIDYILDNVFRRFINEAKPPLLIISDITQDDSGVFDDITILSGCKKIRKFIDPEIQKTEIKDGNAADPMNPETIHAFAGTCEEVIADYVSAKFSNPKYFYTDDTKTTHTEVYENHLTKLESEYDKAKSEGKKIVEVYKYRQRINAIKGSMVDIFVGGISAQDRDQKGDMLEDAVLNCRSACQNGVGYGANFEALRAINDILKTPVDVMEEDMAYFDEYVGILKLLKNSYIELGVLLYLTCTNGDREKALDIVNKTLENDSPYNIRTKSYDKSVLSSIMTDQCVLNSIAEILTIMFVTNQMILFDINRCDYFNK